MELIFYFIIFVFGTFVGSFLNCVIYRLKQEKKSLKGGRGRKTVGFLRGRSFCPKCKHTLRWYDLVPILSFLMLRAKCRYCSKKISWQYPTVETATGLLFLLISNFPTFALAGYGGQAIFNFQTVINMGYLWLVASFLVIIFVYDLKHYIIPDKIIYPAIGLVFLYRLFENLIIENWSFIENWYSKIGQLKLPLLAACGAAAFFFLIWFVSGGKWMGFGDVKLGFFIGLFLGFPNVLVALFSTFLIGGIIGIALVLFGKKKLRSEIPFGPFLVLGAFIALFWAEPIINWYISLIA